MKVYGIQIEDISTEDIFTSCLVKNKQDAENIKIILEDPLNFSKYHLSYDHKDPAYYVFGNDWYDIWEICISNLQTPEDKIDMFKTAYLSKYNKSCHFTDGMIMLILDISKNANYMKSAWVKYDIIEFDLF